MNKLYIFIESSTNLKPVDSAAVDQRRKHPQSRSEGIPYGAHRQYDVQVGLDPLDEVVVHGNRVSLDLATRLLRYRHHLIHQLDWQKILSLKKFKTV